MKKTLMSWKYYENFVFVPALVIFKIDMGYVVFSHGNIVQNKPWLLVLLMSLLAALQNSDKDVALCDNTYKTLFLYEK